MRGVVCAPVPKDRLGRAFRGSLDFEASIARVPARESGEAPLLHATRRRIFLAVFDEPEIAVRPLARLLQMPVQSVAWHVRRLVASGVLRHRKKGRSRQLRTDDLGAAESWLAALQCETCFRVSDALLGRGRTQSELTRDLGTYSQALRHHLGKLRKSGVASQDRDRAWRLVRPQSLFRNVLAAVPHRRSRLLEVLTSNGLAPRVLEERGDSLELELALPDGKEKVFVPLVPRVIRRIMAADGPVGSS